MAVLGQSTFATLRPGGGILPDMFIQRVEDDLEFHWGDRVQPGVAAPLVLFMGLG